MAKFTRTIEDFTCEHCGAKVKGNGYTNHCPKCLWSKHVDINPGDRSSDCKGMMEPIRVEIKAQEYIIIQKCQKCGHERKNTAAANDNMDLIINLATTTLSSSSVL